jgi:hypothetical protein
LQLAIDIKTEIFVENIDLDIKILQAESNLCQQEGYDTNVAISKENQALDLISTIYNSIDEQYIN